MLRYRLLFGSLLGLVVLAVLLLDGYLSSLLPRMRSQDHISDPIAWACNGMLSSLAALVLTLLITREVLRFFFSVGQHPFPQEACFFAGGLVLGPFVAGNLDPGAHWRNDSWGMFWLALALGSMFLRQAVFRGAERALTNLATTIFVIFYCGGLFGFMIKLRMEVGGPLGVTLLLFSLAAVKITDIGAYFAGRFFGRTPLVPWLSPKKTWEGLVGGVLLTLAFAVTAGLLIPATAEISLRGGWVGPSITLLLFGLLMAGASVAGDLFESLLKRDASLKDSGEAIPGFGGMLDILDSPLLAAPVAWFFWTRLVVFPAAAM